jgi:hypothetical protein
MTNNGREEKVRLKVNLILGNWVMRSGSIVPLAKVPENLRKPDYISHDLENKQAVGFDEVDASGQPVVWSGTEGTWSEHGGSGDPTRVSMRSRPKNYGKGASSEAK